MATVEHKKYPFTATQWHPEKNMFEREPNYGFLDKSTPTIRFLTEIIQLLVDRVRPQAKPWSQIPTAIQPYFSIYSNPLVTLYNDYERVYVMQKIFPSLPAVNGQENEVDQIEIKDGPGEFPNAKRVSIVEESKEKTEVLTE